MLDLDPRPANAAALRERFARRLFERSPWDVLDVGCGQGDLLELCRRADVTAQGVEPSKERVEALGERGLRALAAEANQLPFGDSSFDWVTIRHVLHHLPDPGAAVREASRVARRGMILAEPWHDRSEPSQELALRIDRWRKRQDRRRGAIHGPDLAPGEILALLPPGEFEAELEIVQRYVPWPLELVDDALRDGARDLAPDHADQGEARALLEEATRRLPTLNGSAILVLTRVREG